MYKTRISVIIFSDQRMATTGKHPFAAIFVSAAFAAATAAAR
jgi:hypothetical protein